LDVLGTSHVNKAPVAGANLESISYVLYIASFLSYNHTRNAGFVIGAGAILGISAALLWAAETVIMISYPPENKKGKYIGIFWMIFNLGAGGHLKFHPILSIS
jgi:MFS family permease